MMGALSDGYDAARRKYEEQVSEHHRKELDVDDHLHAVAAMLDQDATFLKDKEFSHETSHRILRINHRRSPVITVHFDPEDKNYIVTFMRDGTRAAMATADECAGAIGAMMFEELAATREPM
jgi:hypothetical protein